MSCCLESEAVTCGVTGVATGDMLKSPSANLFMGLPERKHSWGERAAVNAAVYDLGLCIVYL